MDVAAADVDVEEFVGIVIVFFVNDTAYYEIYTLLFVGSVRGG